MKENDLNVFIDSTKNYFQQTTHEEAVAGVPYVKGKDPLVLDFTGIVGISGKRKGCIYLTTPHKMLGDLGEIILGDSECGEQELKDLVGEIANTIAGNARNVYGSSFLVSVPAVALGIPEDITFPEELPAFIVPFKWRVHRSFLVVCLE
jgi:chemotaxis protein CheX